jgi:hypothetical protein
MPPPGYVPYGPGGQRGFEPIRSVSKWLVILLAVGAGAQVLTVLAQAGLRGDTDRLVNGLDGLDAGFGLYLLVSLAAAAVSIASLVLQVVFAFRIAKNLQLLGRTPASFSPGATIATVILGGCTLGILPYFMWRELWAGSEPGLPAHTPDWKRRPAPQIITIQLVLTLLSTVFGLGVGAASAVLRIGSTSSSDLGKSLDNSFGWLLLSGLLSAAATVALMLLVRQLAERHMQATREA